jgi:hypothetical protein
LWPKDFTCEHPETHEQITIHGSSGQDTLYEYWLDFCRKCDDEGVDTVILDGDALHGTNRKEYGMNLMTEDLEIQKIAACQLLAPLVKYRNFIALSGSLYHESLDTRVHKDIAEKLGGKYAGLLWNGKLQGTNRTMNIAHGVSGAAIYRTTVMDREGHLMLQAQALGKLEKFDLIVRAHWHYFIHIHFAQQHLIQLPCWICWEPNKIYVRYYGRMQADIGGVILNIDEKDRISVWHYLYKTVHIADKMGVL